MTRKLRKILRLVSICETAMLIVLIVIQILFSFAQDYFASNIVGLGCGFFSGSAITLAVIDCIAQKVNDQEEIQEPEENPDKVATESEIPSSSL